MRCFGCLSSSCCVWMEHQGTKTCYWISFLLPRTNNAPPPIQTFHRVIWSQIHFIQLALFLNRAQNGLKVHLPEIIHVRLKPHVCQTRPALKHPAFSTTGRKRGKGSDHYTNSCFLFRVPFVLVHTHVCVCVGVCVYTLPELIFSSVYQFELDFHQYYYPAFLQQFLHQSADTKGSRLTCPASMFKAGFGTK